MATCSLQIALSLCLGYILTLYPEHIHATYLKKPTHKNKYSELEERPRYPCSHSFAHEYGGTSIRLRRCLHERYDHPSRMYLSLLLSVLYQV